jgi:hypothetical protein
VVADKTRDIGFDNDSLTDTLDRHISPHCLDDTERFVAHDPRIGRCLPSTAVNAQIGPTQANPGHRNPHVSRAEFRVGDVGDDHLPRLDEECRLHFAVSRRRRGFSVIIRVMSSDETPAARNFGITDRERVSIRHRGADEARQEGGVTWL